jgi:AhpD family alkylhydroperoxidase
MHGTPLAYYFIRSITTDKEDSMKREEVYKEIERMLGLVPAMFKALPDSSLELEWQLFKRVQFDEGAIPNKYRELIGVAISAITKCRYCSFYHTEVARLNGATEAEIEDAVHFAKSSAGWSTYINGLQIDYELFKKEILQACEHVRSMKKSV